MLPLTYPMSGTKLTYHFEEAHSREELEDKVLGLAKNGWKPAGEPRRVEMIFPSGRVEWRFSQACTRPTLFPVCQRVRAILPQRFEVLGSQIKPCEHLVYFYDDETLFLRSLESFIVQGLMAGEAVVVIALPEHRSALQFRLAAHGLDLSMLEADRQLLLLDAQTTLSRLLRDGLPNEVLFEEAMGGLIAQLRAQHRTVRAFGEMVGILWSEGNRAATLRLEELWHQYCQREGLVLYCAYRLSAFETEQEAMQQICASHSQLIEA
jgi:hypothetical protein